MKQILKALFRPTLNRNYVGKKTHLRQYLLLYTLPAILLVVVMTNLGFNKFIALGIVFGYLLLNYLVIDRFIDSFRWKILRRFYKDKDSIDNKAHDAMRAYDENPSESAKSNLKKHLK